MNATAKPDALDRRIVSPAPAPARVISTSTTMPGSPAATATIDGKRLPAPDPAFGGVIRQEALQSKAWAVVPCRPIR